MATLPEFTFPDSTTGWLVVLVSALAGLVAGGLVMNLLRGFIR